MLDSRMQREQERERRRLRDRQRRQSMTQEQRERHLARRRRNYQLRRQRAANAPLIPLPQNQVLGSSTGGEASTSDELQWVTSTSSNYTVLYQGRETLNVGNIAGEGSSIQLEAQAYNPMNLPTRLRLNHIKRFARSLVRPMGDTIGNQRVPSGLIAKGDASGGDDGSAPKPLRLNRVKRLARTINSLSKETATLKNHNGTGTVDVEQNMTQSSIQSLGSESCTALQPLTNLLG